MLRQFTCLALSCCLCMAMYFVWQRTSAHVTLCLACTKPPANIVNGAFLFAFPFFFSLNWYFFTIYLLIFYKYSSVYFYSKWFIVSDPFFEKNCRLTALCNQKRVQWCHLSFAKDQENTFIYIRYAHKKLATWFLSIELTPFLTNFYCIASSFWLAKSIITTTKIQTRWVRFFLWNQEIHKIEIGRLVRP